LTGNPGRGGKLAQEPIVNPTDNKRLRGDPAGTMRLAETVRRCREGKGADAAVLIACM
jgi:hypothetical protein